MKISKKFKKRLEISSFYKCTKNHDHRLYCSWDMVCDGCNCFWFWAIFYPFTPYQPKKCKFQKMKFTQVYIPKIMIICMLYCSWDMVCDGCNCFSFWAIFYPFNPYQPKKCKFQKMKFTQVYQKSWSYAILFLRYGTWHVIIFHFGLFFTLLPP